MAPKVSSGSFRLENMLQVPENCGKAAENERARSAPSPQFIISFSGAKYFGLTSTNVSAYDIFICGFQGKPKTPGVSSVSLRLEITLQVPENCGEAAKNERARSAPSPQSIVSFSGAM